MPKADWHKYGTEKIKEYKEYIESLEKINMDTHCTGASDCEALQHIHGYFGDESIDYTQ